MGSSQDNVPAMEKMDDANNVSEITDDSIVGDTGNLKEDLERATTPDKVLSDANTSKEETNTGGKKTKKKSRHNKKGYTPSKDNVERNPIRRLHHTSIKFKQCRKKVPGFLSISKFFLPNKRPRKETFIPPTKFLLGGNISDPLNLNSLQDEDINRAMNAVTPESSPLPTPPRHKAKIDVIIPPNIRDPLNLMEPLDNDEYEKRLEMQQRKPRKKPKLRRKTTDISSVKVQDVSIKKEEDPGKSEVSTGDPSTSSKSRKRSNSECDNKNKDSKKLRRMDSLDKIVSPVVPQPGAWMRFRPQSRPALPERPVSPHRTNPSSDAKQDKKTPTFHPKDTKYQYGNYDRYYGYRNLNASMDVRLQVFEMYRYLFENKDVLDIGCNVGHISIAVARNLGARSVMGIDIDPVLIGRARKNLHTFVPVPTDVLKTEDQKNLSDDPIKSECDSCVQSKCDECPPQEPKAETSEDSRKPQGRKLRRPRKNRKAIGKSEQVQFYFPMSMPMLYGPLGLQPEHTAIPTFPYNVTFKQSNYVPREDVCVGGAESAQFDLVLCLSTTKWVHLNWGDAGLKRAFRRIFNDLRPGGKLILEAQNWASYKKKKRLTSTIYENFNSIEMFPNKFREYLLSPEVGFSSCTVLGTPQHASKGFRRPIQLFVKGDFTPSQARWSDARAPSSHHRPSASPARRPVYAPPVYAPVRSEEALSAGAATPQEPNLECCADDSPFYNPRSDSYAPSYQPPRPTVYATLGSPLSPAPYTSPAPPMSPMSPKPPAPHASPGPEQLSARVYLAPPPYYKPHED